MQPETYLSVIMRSRALLGMRLHSLIYAGNVATPAVALIYQDKVLGLVEEAGLEHVHVDSMSVEELYTKLEEVLKDSEAKKQSIVAFHKSMKQRESQNISLFRALISKE